MSDYGPFLPRTARDVALDRLRWFVDQGMTTDEILARINTSWGGGNGPARDGYPAAGYQYPGVAMFRHSHLGRIPRDRIGAYSGDDAGIFDVRVLVAEIRSGLRQATLFEAAS